MNDDRANAAQCAPGKFVSDFLQVATSPSYRVDVDRSESFQAPQRRRFRVTGMFDPVTRLRSDDDSCAS